MGESCAVLMASVSSVRVIGRLYGSSSAVYEFQDFWPLNSPDLNPVSYKIWGIESTRKSAGCE